jgi:NAD+ diphosphatase
MTPDQLLARLAMVSPGHDRESLLRGDADAIAAFLASSRARVLPVWKQRHPFVMDAAGAPVPVHLSPVHLSEIADPGDAVFLGTLGDTPWFGIGLPDSADAPDVGGEFRVLTEVLALLPAHEAGLLAHARAMVIWHGNHRHCGRCGAPTRPSEAGHSRTCTDPACGHRSFPRTDPAVITAIVHPDGEHVLLGRQPQWPAGVFSTIAGFVEPGETLEAAVQREVLEETGVTVSDVRYVASQPWPFPSSIMLGFRCRAETTAIVRNDQELEDCRWFSRAAVRAGGAWGSDGPGLKLPNVYSISRYLIDSWAYAR